jgi:MFS family permease
MKNNKIIGIERNIFFIGLTSFFTDTSTKMVYSVMPLFLLSMGASKTTISLIEGIAESTAALTKVFAGYWSDRIGRNKLFMAIGYGVTALVTPFYAFTQSALQVLGLRFIERLGKGVRTAPRDSLISASAQKKDAGKSFGFHKAMDNSGAIVGPLAAFGLLYLFPHNYANIFLWASIPAIVGLLTILIFIKETKVKAKENRPKFRFKELPKKFYLFLFIVFIFTLGNSADALLLIKTAETGINKAYIPFLYLIFNTVSVILAIPVGKISDKIGRKVLITFGFLVYAVVYFMFGRYNNIHLFIGLFLFYGVYSALTDGNLKAWISDIVDKDSIGTGYGIYHGVLGITLLPASLIAGVLYDKVNSNAPFYFGALMAFIAAALMVIYTLLGKRSYFTNNNNNN